MQRLYEIRFTGVAVKDIKKLTPALKAKVKNIVNAIAINPYIGKRLVGDLTGFFSLRLTYKDRIVYSIDQKHRIIYIHRAKTHYGD